ncbi:MAG: hypothetical protein ACJA01_000771 [Saprospiraceae bacterium]|jgi:hypothetical protein
MNRNFIKPDRLINSLISKQQVENQQFALLVSSLVGGGVIRGIEDLRFDHIRFLTADLPSLGKSMFEMVLFSMGYKSCGYEIKAQAITTYSYYHPQRYYPRVDIDMAEMLRLPKYLRQIINQYEQQIAKEQASKIIKSQEDLYDLLFAPRWSRASLGHYKVLMEDHPLLAQLVHHQCPVANCVLKIDALPEGYSTYPEFLDYLKGLGMEIDRSRDKRHAIEGGAVHTFSTIPSIFKAIFADGEEVEISQDFLLLAIKQRVIKTNRLKPEVAI